MNVVLVNSFLRGSYVEKETERLCLVLEEGDGK